MCRWKKPYKEDKQDQETVQAQECWPGKEGSRKKEISKDISQRRLLTHTDPVVLLKWLTCKLVWSLLDYLKSIAAQWVGCTFDLFMDLPVFNHLQRSWRPPWRSMSTNATPGWWRSGEKPEKRGTDPSSYWGLVATGQVQLLWCPRGVHRWLVGLAKTEALGTCSMVRRPGVWKWRTLPVSSGAPGRMGREAGEKKERP